MVLAAVAEPSWKRGRRTQGQEASSPVTYGGTYDILPQGGSTNSESFSGRVQPRGASQQGTYFAAHMPTNVYHLLV